jgi:hypothetical protein
VEFSISFATLAGAYIGESLEDHYYISIFNFAPLLLTKQGSFKSRGIKFEMLLFSWF